MPPCNQPCCTDKQYRSKQSDKRFRKRAARKVRRREAYWAVRNAPPPRVTASRLDHTREQVDNRLPGYIPLAHPLLIPLLTRDLSLIVDSFLGHERHPTISPPSWSHQRDVETGTPYYFSKTYFPTFPFYKFTRDRRESGLINWEVGLTAHPILLDLLTEIPTSVIDLFLGYSCCYSSPW
jgi:hypothetical protein